MIDEVVIAAVGQAGALVMLGLAGVVMAKFRPCPGRCGARSFDWWRNYAV